MEQTKYDVFISYSRKDYVDEQKNVIPGNEVSKIKEALTKAGITYWFDEEGIYSGQNFVEKIVTNIEASRIFVFLSTANANNSKYTCREIASADEFGKHIIPVRIDSAPYNKKVLFRIADLDYIEYYTNPEKGMTDLINSIKNYLEQLQMEEDEHACFLYRKHDINGCYGYIDRTGEYVIPPIWKEAPTRISEKEIGLFVQDKSGKWGIVGRDGNIMVPCIWDGYERTSDYKAFDKYQAVKTNGKWGFVNDKGNYEIPPILDNVEYNYNWECWIVRNEDKWGIIKEASWIIPCICDEFKINIYGKHDCSCLHIYERAGIYIVQQNNLWGGYDSKGNLVIPYVWKKIFDDSPFEHLIMVKDINERYGFIDYHGRLIVPCQWYDISRKAGEGLVAVENDKKEWGYINDKGSMIIPCVLRMAGDFSEGLACVLNEKGIGGYINPDGSFAFYENDDWSIAWGEFHDGLAKVKDGNFKFGFINHNGELVIPCKWHWVLYGQFLDGYAWVNEEFEDKYCVVDVNGNIVTECAFYQNEETSFWNDFMGGMNQGGLLIVSEERSLDCKRVSIANRKGNLILPFGEWNAFVYYDYEKCGREREKSHSIEYVSIINDKGWGKLTPKGKWITPCIWNNNHEFHEGLCPVQDFNEKWGCINKEGKLVMPCIYDEPLLWADGRVIIEDKDGISRYMDQTGTYLELI